MKKEKWLEKLKVLEAFPYIKPNRKIHESGWRCFEVGYLTVDDNIKIKDKLVLGEYTDHIQPFEWLDFSDGKLLLINIDLTKDGYIRFHSRKPIWWGGMNFVVSSATIEELTTQSLITEL